MCTPFRGVAGARTEERLQECQHRLESAAATNAVAVYTGGSTWPESLAGRRQLVTVALHGYRICLDSPAVRGNRFDPERVRLEEIREAVSSS